MKCVLVALTAGIVNLLAVEIVTAGSIAGVNSWRYWIGLLLMIVSIRLFISADRVERTGNDPQRPR